MHGALDGRVCRLTVLVALGTHAPMTEAAAGPAPRLPAGELAAPIPGMTVLNHEWADPETFVSLGSSRAERVAELSEGRLRREPSTCG